MRGATGSLATPSADVFNVDAHDEHHNAAHRQDLARKLTSSIACCNTALTIIGAPGCSNHGSVLASSVAAMVQVPPEGTVSSLQLGVSFQLALSADELAVAGLPVMQEMRAVKETEIGPGITLGYHSVEDYNFIMSLTVIEEEQY